MLFKTLGYSASLFNIAIVYSLFHNDIVTDIGTPHWNIGIGSILLLSIFSIQLAITFWLIIPSYFIISSILIPSSILLLLHSRLIISSWQIQGKYLFTYCCCYTPIFAALFPLFFFTGKKNNEHITY